MMEFELKKIPLCDRENIFIVNDNIDRLAWMIVDDKFDPKVPSSNKLVTKSEINSFAHKNYEEGDILFWDNVAEEYIKFEDCLLNGELNQLDKYCDFLLDTLQVKHVAWDNKSHKDEEKKHFLAWVITGHDNTVNANAALVMDHLNKLLTKSEDILNFTAKEDESKPVDYDRVKKELERSGLIRISHYQRAFNAAKRKGDIDIEYKFFQQIKNQINVAAMFGVSLSKSLGIEAFGMWSFLSDKKLSASFKIKLEF